MFTAAQIVTIIGFIFASNGFWSFLSTRSQKKKVNFEKMVSDLDVQKEANKALLHDRLFEACLLCIKQQYVTPEELDNIDHMFKPYELLGGNGTVKKLVKDVKHLPIYDAERSKK